jgi:hypothetical protein
LIPGSHLKKVDGFCYVVNNPLGNELSYCLPLGVITYDNSDFEFMEH